MDFTLHRYRELLSTLQDAGYLFCTIRELTDAPAHCGRRVFLRHDVDLRPERSLATARIEAGMGIRATYYFRAVPQSWDETIIRAIASMGHEVGYHYESMTTCSGDADAAYRDFCVNLAALRRLTDVSTVCMHGSPRSRYDSRDLWKRYEYRSLGIKFEPYMDTDWSDMFYLTDTGRRWDGYRVSVRDRIPEWQERWDARGWRYHSTEDVMEAARKGILPKAIMITTHPQRWTSSPAEWAVESVVQKVKNVLKSVLILVRGFEKK